MGKNGEVATYCGLKALVQTVKKLYLGQTTASCLHLIFVCCFFFLALFPLLLCLWEVSDVGVLSMSTCGPLPHGEPDLLARFYGPFQSFPGLNTASCWPHGHNVVPCPSGEERGGRLDSCQKGFTEATSICGHVEASDIRRKRNAADLVFLVCCFDILCSLLQNEKPLNTVLLTDRKLSFVPLIKISI